MFGVVTRLPDGRWAEVDVDVLSIGRRIAEGDPTVGWRGDPSMALFWNEDLLVFEVWGVDVRGNPYLAASHPTCDQTLLVKLRDGDWRGDLFGEVERRNEEVRRDRDRVLADAAEDRADRLHHALVKDVGHLEGGTRRLFAVGGSGGD